MIVCAPTINPPPPRPCRARNAISSVIVWLNPHSAEPTTKITIDAWKKVLRPYWSPSLPHRGVDTVEASRYAVTTHARWEPPCRSPTMVGSAVDTMVWSSAARSMPSSSAPRITQRRRLVIFSTAGAGAATPTLTSPTSSTMCSRVRTS